MKPFGLVFVLLVAFASFTTAEKPYSEWSDMLEPDTFRSKATAYHTEDLYHKPRHIVNGRAQGAYVWRKVEACCLASCGLDKNCQIGCDSWLQKSSLNSDSPENWKKGDGLHSPTYENHQLLLGKCKRDCLEGKKWSKMRSTITTRTSPGDDETPTDLDTFNLQHRSYWHNHVGHLEQECQTGCVKYYDCMPGE
jgi:hypothetical protein